MNVWEVVTAIGTLAAVLASVTFGLFEGLRSRRDRDELAALRTSTNERERLGVASLVTAWISETYVPDSQAETYVRRAVLHVANESNEPVVNANATVYLSGGRSVGPMSAPNPIPVLPARREFTWDITTGLGAHDSSDGPLVGLGFTDSHGRRWHRRLDGTLTESTGKEVFHYAEDSHEEAMSQIGQFDPWRNPMAVALGFAQAVWKDPDFSFEELTEFLDPIAKGWQGEWTTERTRELRELFGEFENLAAHATYAAPRVAYARVFTSAALNSVTLAGTGLAVEARFITLVHRGDIGWRVFGVGPRFRPDEIHFPDMKSSDTRAD